jgi:inner membrane protein
MSPITHLFIGWLISNSSDKCNRRDRIIISIAGVIPDIDGIGIIAQLLTQHSNRPLMWFSDYHHKLGHNIGFCLVYVLIAYFLSKGKWIVALLSFVSFHLHLLGDLIGSRSPDGYQWPIPYLLPFSDKWQLSWQYQWALNAWPNFLITGLSIILIFLLARNRGYSAVEIFSVSADKQFVNTIRQRFPVNEKRT